VDTTHKRVYEMQRQLCALQDRLDDLTDVLDNLEDPAEAAPAAPVVSPRDKPAAAVRKKVTAKKAAAKPKSRAKTKSE